jgi:hypothetical protein
MNRRDFLKRLGAAGLVAVVAPEIIVPERRVWALDWTMTPPARARGDDTAWLQWHIDHARMIPPDVYHTTDTLIVRDGDVLNMSGSQMFFESDIAVRFERGFSEDDRLSNSIIMPNHRRDFLALGFQRETTA